jgi:hypothetical protein
VPGVTEVPRRYGHRQQTPSLGAPTARGGSLQIIFNGADGAWWDIRRNQMALRDAIATPEGNDHVRRLLGTIADRYDLITVLLSYGQTAVESACRDGVGAPGDARCRSRHRHGDIAFSLCPPAPCFRRRRSPMTEL